MAFSDPQKNLRQFSLGEDWHVADFGVGSGGYATAAARLMPGGRVYAVDIKRGLLTKLKKESESKKIHNIEVIWGDVEERQGSHLGDGSMDAVIVANLLFQAESKKMVAEEVWRVLRSRGRVLVVDWTDSFGGLGPHRDHVFLPEKAKKLFQETGFDYEREIQAGPHHYGLIFKKR